MYPLPTKFFAKIPGRGAGGAAVNPTRAIPTGDVQTDNPEPPAKSDIPVQPVVAPKVESHVTPLKKESTAGLDALFGEEETSPKVEPKAEPSPEPPKVEPAVPKEEEEIDFTKPPKGSEEENRETAAQIRARENGQALEALKTEHQETLLELERLKGEVELVKKNGGPQHQREEDFARHPEVVGIRRNILDDRNAVAETQTLPEAGQVVTRKFGEYMEKYLAGKSEADEEAARAIDAGLRKEIADDFQAAYKQANGENFDEKDLASETKAFTREVLQLLVRNSGKTMEIQNKLGELSTKAREGRLAQGVEVYQFHEDDLKKVIAAIPQMPQAVIDENPHSVEATVATLLQQKPWQDRFAVTEKKVLELLLGPKAFSQADLDHMVAGGVDPVKFGKDRQKKWLDGRRRLAVDITRALLLAGVWEQTSRKAAAHDDSHDELTILSRGKAKDPDPPPAPKKEGRKAGEPFRSAIEDVLTEAGM